MDHPPYSPDLAPRDFLAVFKIKKMPCKNKDLLTFQKSNATQKRYWGIPENDFQDCFQQWHHRITKCIASREEYFEGESNR
jgi:hypothetical protein